jgi:Putative peptidoglycan binding domain
VTVIVDPVAISAVVAKSELAKVSWKDRGRAPLGYLKGMAIMFAWCQKRLEEGHPTAVDMAHASKGDPDHDALSWYRGILEKAGLTVDKDGIDTLRALFVLQIGLGMRESSGRFCEGRDRSAQNTTADSAEAGLFQQSWDSHAASALIADLMNEYDITGSGYRAIFAEGVTCSSTDLACYGDSNSKGYEFQLMCKARPGFAVEACAIGLRHLRKHWGPINTHAAEVRPEADRLLRLIQTMSTGKEDSGGAVSDADDEMAHGMIWLQWALNRLGATPKLEEDGILGPATRSMVRIFQEEYDLPVSGVPDEKTMNVIGEHLDRELHPLPKIAIVINDGKVVPIPKGTPLPPTSTTTVAQSITALFKKLFG